MRFISFFLSFFGRTKYNRSTPAFVVATGVGGPRDCVSSPGAFCASIISASTPGRKPPGGMKNGRNPSVSTKNPGNMAAWVLITGARTRRRIAIIAGPVWRGVGLRTRSMVRRRGGLHGRPGRLLIFTAPPPNAVGAAISRPGRLAISTAAPPNVVGRHAHMPPWSGRDAREPGASGGAVRAHIQCAPTTRRVAGASVGADFISARTGPRFAPHPRRTS